MRFARSALLEPGNDLFRYGCRFQPRRIVRMTADQHTGFERLDRQSFALEHLVGHLEARTLETLDPALDRGRVVEHLEIARVIDDVGGVAVTPLDLHIPAVDEHCFTESLYWNTSIEVP